MYQSLRLRANRLSLTQCLFVVTSPSSAPQKSSLSTTPFPNSSRSTPPSLVRPFFPHLLLILIFACRCVDGLALRPPCLGDSTAQARRTWSRPQAASHRGQVHVHLARLRRSHRGGGRRPSRPLYHRSQGHAQVRISSPFPSVFAILCPCNHLCCQHAAS